MTDEELNAKIGELDGVVFPFQVKGLEGSGKIVPYIGWFWRDIYFDARGFLIGWYPGDDEHRGFAGFMPRDKWEYMQAHVRIPHQIAKVRELCEALVMAPNEDTAQALFDYMQTLAPEWIKGGRS